MRAPDQRKIVEAAMELRAHNPAGWDQFVTAVSDYASQVLSMTLGADPALVMRAQGMAIQAAEIAQVLREAPQIHAAAQQALAAKQRAPNHANRKPAGSTYWPA